MTKKATRGLNSSALDKLRAGSQNEKELISKTVLDALKKELIKEVKHAIPNYRAPIPTHDLKCVENLLDKITPDDLASYLINLGDDIKDFFKTVLLPKAGNNKDLKKGYNNLIRATRKERMLGSKFTDLFHLNDPIEENPFFSNIIYALQELLSPDIKSPRVSQAVQKSLTVEIGKPEVSPGASMDSTINTEVQKATYSTINDQRKGNAKFDDLHLHVFVREKQSSKPLEGIPVIALAESKSEQKIPLGMLASNHIGYISFDFSHKNIQDYEHIWIFSQDENQRIDARPIIGSSPEEATILLDIDQSQMDSDGPKLALPSVQNPTINDFLNSPNSFAVNPTARLGTGGCEYLLPGNFAEHEFSFRHIVLGRKPPSMVEPLQKTDNKDREDSLKVRSGDIYEYRISWIPIGHSLGRLVYSLPLAPCESVNLAVIDWSRTDEAQRGEDLTVREQLIHNQRRDRIIEETVTAGLAEWQRGGSVMGGLAGSYNAGTASISGAAGGAYATSSGDRDIEVSTIQRIADNISQASNSVRNLHSTVIIQSSQKERDVVQTRTVTNHNHCHAMTVLYYEVLRHYRVVTKLQMVQKGIMIKFPTIKFDMNNIENILNRRLILEQALLDKRLSNHFDDLAKFNFIHSTISESVPAQNGSEAPQNFIFTGFQIAFTTGESGTLGDAHVIFLKPNGDEIILKSTEPTKTGVPEKFRHPDPRNDFQKNATDWFRAYSSDTVRWGNIRDVEIRLTSAGPLVNDWDLAHLQIYGILADERRFTLFDDRIGFTIHPDRGPWVRKTLRSPPSSLPPDDPKKHISMEESRRIKDLIGHLNAHETYYNNAIRMFCDYDETLQFLENYRTFDGDGSTSIIDQIENRPIASVGRYIVFPSEIERLVFDGNGNGDSGGVRTQQNVPKRRNLSVNRIVSLPTRGLFAEAQLSHCNSCEERDITRFWDWSQSPCPEKAPEIENVTPGTRAVQQNLEPTNLPNSVVNIVNPPNAPDPTGLAAAMNVLAASNIFRDMSGIQQVGSLLNTLVQANASRPSGSSGSSGSSGTTTTPSQPSDGRGRSTTSGGTSPTQALPRPTAQEQHDQLQVNRNAEQHGELTSQQRQDLGRSYLEDANVTSEPEGTEQIQSEPHTYSILLANFDRNETSLKPDHSLALQVLISALTEESSLPGTRIYLIEGHAKADENSAQRLSTQRAEVVRDYLRSNGLDNSRFSGNLQGVGSSNPIRGNPRAPDMDVNRSVVLRMSSTLQSRVMTARRSDIGETSNQWELKLGLIFSPMGMVTVIEIKNARTGQIRSGLFLGGGLLSLEYVRSSPFRTGRLQYLMQSHNITESSYPNEWIRFRTGREISFSELDGAQAILRAEAGAESEYFIGPAHFVLEFPRIEPGHYIDFGEHPGILSTGVKNSENKGIWKEMGLTTLR